MSDLPNFELAGAELSWPMGIASGMTNHPDIEVVARRFGEFVSLGVGEVALGSAKLGEASGGNAHLQQPDGKWMHLGGDESVDTEEGIGRNSKAMPGPGARALLERLPDFVDLAKSKDTEVSLSLSPHTQNPLEEIPELLAVAEMALTAGVLRVEFNLSCPNVPDRPPFYLDSASVRTFIELANARKDSLRNRFDRPGLYPKFGPMGNQHDEISLRQGFWRAAQAGAFGGLVTSNTVPDQHESITVNNGRCGQSGPYFEQVGRQQINRWTLTGISLKGSGNPELVSSLGVSGGEDIAWRMARHGASMCQLASVVHWPELVGEESAGAVVEKIKGQFVDVIMQAD